MGTELVGSGGEEGSSRGERKPRGPGGRGGGERGSVDMRLELERSRGGEEEKVNGGG